MGPGCRRSKVLLGCPAASAELVAQRTYGRRTAGACPVVTLVMWGIVTMGIQFSLYKNTSETKMKDTGHILLTIPEAWHIAS